MKYFLFFIALFFSLSVYSQNVRFTVIGEPQISWMSPVKDNISGEGIVTGLNAGLGVDFFFAENYAFSTGLSLSSLGGKLACIDTLNYNRTAIPSLSIIRYKIQYVSLPLGLKFNTDEIGYSTYFANLGINPMIRIKAKGTDSKEIIENDNITEEIRFLNIAYFLFLGTHYSLGGSTSLVGGVGYSSGITDVISDSDYKAVVRTVTIRLGILF